MGNSLLVEAANNQYKQKVNKHTAYSKRLLTEEGLLDEVLEEVLGHGGRRLVNQLDDD